MTERLPDPKANLSKLRHIGWGLWDPIGILEPEGPLAGKWEGQPFADEYDRYMISAATQLRKGAPPEFIVEYLVYIETQYIGLREVPSTRQRAEAVVSAILASQDIWI